MLGNAGAPGGGGSGSLASGANNNNSNTSSSGYSLVNGVGVASLAAHLNASNNTTNAQTPSPVSSVMSSLSLMSQGSGGGGGGTGAGSYLSGAGANVLSGLHLHHQKALISSNEDTSALNISCDHVISVSNNSLTTGGCLTQSTPTGASQSEASGICSGSGSTHDLTGGSVGELSPGDGEDSNMSNNLASECMELDSDEEEDEDDKGNVMIYPWMKKIHVGGVPPGTGKIRGTPG